MYRVILAIGNDEIESFVNGIKDVQTVEHTDDLGILEDILEYLEADYIILNSLLNKRKTVKAAVAAREHGIKVITLLEDMGDKEFIAAMVGSGASAFVLFDELETIEDVLKQYPNEFDFGTLVQTSVKAQKRLFQEPEQLRGDGKKMPPAMNVKKPILFDKKNISIKGTVTIGVFSVSRGAGSTRTAVKLAEQLARYMKVACVEFDGRQDLEYIYDCPTKADYTTSEDGEIAKMMIDLIYGSGDYEVIVIDFGNLFEISNQGKLLNIDKLDQMKAGEFQRCRHKVGLGFAEEWHTGKLQMFEREEFLETVKNGKLIFVLSGDAAQVKAAQKEYDFHIFNRSEEGYLEYMLSQFGIASKKKRKTILPRKEKVH